MSLEPAERNETQSIQPKRDDTFPMPRPMVYTYALTALLDLSETLLPLLHLEDIPDDKLSLTSPFDAKTFYFKSMPELFKLGSAENCCRLVKIYLGSYDLNAVTRCHKLALDLCDEITENLFQAASKQKGFGESWYFQEDWMHPLYNLNPFLRVTLRNYKYLHYLVKGVKERCPWGEDDGGVNWNQVLTTMEEGYKALTRAEDPMDHFSFKLQSGEDTANATASNEIERILAEENAAKLAKQRESRCIVM